MALVISKKIWPDKVSYSSRPCLDNWPLSLATQSLQRSDWLRNQCPPTCLPVLVKRNIRAWAVWLLLLARPMASPDSSWTPDLSSNPQGPRVTLTTTGVPSAPVASCRRWTPRPLKWHLSMNSTEHRRTSSVGPCKVPMVASCRTNGTNRTWV